MSDDLGKFVGRKGQIDFRSYSGISILVTAV